LAKSFCNAVISLSNKPACGNSIFPKDFTAKTLKTKRKYRDKDKNIRQQMLQSLKQTAGISPEIEQSMKKVVHWDK
jgi:hypothetical protein